MCISYASQAWLQAGFRLSAPERCDGKSVLMHLSGLLDQAAAIASFCPPLEPLQ